VVGHDSTRGERLEQAQRQQQDGGVVELADQGHQVNQEVGGPDHVDERESGYE
jgi:hypothetical protein